MRSVVRTSQRNQDISLKFSGHKTTDSSKKKPMVNSLAGA